MGAMRWSAISMGTVLYQVGSFSTVSLYSATLLFLIGLGILAARPTRGFMATLMR